MTEILLILILGCLITVYKVIGDMRSKKQEQKELKDKLGEEYDMYMEMRHDRKKT
ncbi:MAG: hypothetical protein ABJR05_12220 [Balneola sp.]